MPITKLNTSPFTWFQDQVHNQETSIKFQGSVEEVMGLESGAPKHKFSPSKIPKRDHTGFKRLPLKFSMKPNPRVEPQAIRKALNLGSVLRSSSDDKWLAAVKHKTVTHTQHAWKGSAISTGWSSRSPPSYNNTEEMVIENRLQCQPGDALTRPLPFSKLQELFMEKCDNDLCASTSSKQKGTDTESMESSEVAVKFEKSLTNHPAESPTWKGKFNVTSNVSSFRFYGGIVAHPPSKVHRKVYELSKQLPKMIQFELLPRLSLWEKLFDKDIPGPTDIGLYFLPSKSCEEMYFSLVERLNQCDMILISSINGVKLLIFTSKNLQDGSQQIDQRYFLWGVFFSCDDQTCLMVEDMEVDMIGGQEMDNVITL